MSEALNTRPDMSMGSQLDLSLGSLPSSFSTPGRPLRVASDSTAPSSAPILTPSPPSLLSSRRKPSETRRTTLSHFEHADDGEADFMDTPAAEHKTSRWDDTPDTPNPSSSRAKRSRPSGPGAKGQTLTLRDQEKHIDHLKKENFDLKLRVHFLEERLQQLAPDQMDSALKQNISLKIEVQQRGMEIKKLKKLVLSLERELDKLRRVGGTPSRERELEEQLAERELELQELRQRRGAGRDDIALRDLEDRNVQLEEEVENLRGLLEETTDELERVQLRDDSADESRGDSKRERMQRRVEELELFNEDIQAKLNEHVDALAAREDEREELLDEIEALRLEVDSEKRKQEAVSLERSESRAMILEERDQREALEDNLNAFRDKLAALTIELQQREDDLDMKNREIDDIVMDHERELESTTEGWRGECAELRKQADQLRDVLDEREAENQGLRTQLADLENQEDAVRQLEDMLSQLELELQDKTEEIERLNENLKHLNEVVFTLEDENNDLKDEFDRIQADEAAERERHEGVSAALKEKAAHLQSQLDEMTELYDNCSQEIHAHRARQEELARHIEDLVEQVRQEQQAHESAVADLDASDKEHDAVMRRERLALEAKESALQSALNDLARTQALLNQRETDLDAVQSALQSVETESKRAGETHTTARFSLQLEVDRLKRDVERLEDELSRARKELDERECMGRERNGALDKLHADVRDLTAQLASQTQARLNLSEKLDSAQSSLRTAESELSASKMRASELEQRLSKDQRSLLNVESQYRDQLTERNTLLLTIYQYMDKILGVDKTPKKGGQAETKPFTNFSVFHDNLITRLKALSQIQLDFDKRCKEAEARFSEKLVDMRKQLDTRWKQIDKFEASVKTYAETKATWRRKFSAKEGELEALKTTNTELTAQLSTSKRPGLSDTMEIRSLSTRAANAERRLMNAQNQLQLAEEKVTAITQKTTTADAKWEARVKEYETRLKAAEEKWKRERQGSKERFGELEHQIKSLNRQLDLAQKRNNQLTDVIQTKQVADSSSNGSR
ncbi:hypothetical protein HGRIS_013877 [Hohenbuehelia grisea]|uniref:Centrosomin N-terminal motif 1 domain-containing protein n=1 Tax=Hohenbuehelia grisea TaxID=104357 RepID=A0ABR3IWY2_9AGAR